MAERQRHGFEYEDIKISEMNLIKEENYYLKKWRISNI
jgi:hypothetical protein